MRFIVVVDFMLLSLEFQINCMRNHLSTCSSDLLRGMPVIGHLRPRKVGCPSVMLHAILLALWHSILFCVCGVLVPECIVCMYKCTDILGACACRCTRVHLVSTFKV